MAAVLDRPLLLVGCGKMGSAMLSGWRESGIVAAGVHIVEPMGAGGVAPGTGVKAVGRAEDLPRDLDPEVVVFAVKPQQMAEVAPQYRKFAGADRSEEHTSELQSLMRISYAVFCLKKKKTTYNINKHIAHNTHIIIT